MPDLPDRIFVYRDEDAPILGLRILDVPDPAGRAEMEPGVYTEYMRAEWDVSAVLLDGNGEIESACVNGRWLTRSAAAKAGGETEPQYVTCPVCDGKHPPTGDGSGWDGANYHDPGCEHCHGEGVVPAEAVALIKEKS